MCDSLDISACEMLLSFPPGTLRSLSPGRVAMTGSHTAEFVERPPEPELDKTIVLLRRFRAGDLRARDRLIERYLPLLTRWARTRSLGTARDLSLSGSDFIQDTFVRALENLDGFEPTREGAFLAYLHTIFTNLVRDAWRKSQRRPQRTDLSESMEGSERSPIDAAISAETMERYWAALERLSERQREAVILRVEFDYSFEEVARAIDASSAEAARKLVTRALPRIAKWMGGKGT